MICALCQLEQENCVCAARKAEAARRDSMRPIGMVTRDVRRQRAREHYESKERMRIASAMSENLTTMDQIYGGEMLRALARARKTKEEKKPSPLTRWFG